MMHRGRRLLLFLLFFYLLGAELGHFMLALCISYNLPRLFFSSFLLFFELPFYSIFFFFACVLRLSRPGRLTHKPHFKPDFCFSLFLLFKRVGTGFSV